VKRACITWTSSGPSQMQNSMRHKSLYEYMLGVRQWRYVTLRHGAFCVSRQHRLCRWWPAHFMYYSWKAHVIIHLWNISLQSVNQEQFPIQMTQNNKHHKWLEILHFQPGLLWRTPTKIHHERRRRRQQEAARKAQRTSLSTAKATSSTQRPQTCTEAATKYYNYTVNGANEVEGTPTADASKSDG